MPVAAFGHDLRMATYLAFLRAINLGARRRFGKDDLAAAVERAGFTEVATHLNTGNVRLVSTLRSTARVEEVLETAFLADRGFEVPTIVLTPGELAEVVADAETLADGHAGKQFVSLLKEAPAPEAIERFEQLSTPDEQARVRGRAVHLLLGESYHQARLTNAVVEKHLGVATNRNLTVLRTLAERWG